MPKKSKSVSKLISVPIWNHSFQIVVTEEIGFLEKKLNRSHEDPYIFAHRYYHKLKSGNDCATIALNFNHEFAKITHGVISHECAHAAGAILESRGQDANYRNDEVFCYLIEWLVDYVYLFLKKHSFKVHTEKP